MHFVRFKGGFGNQLFQLYLYFYLKNKGLSTKIDTSFFKEQENLYFKLYRFLKTVDKRNFNLKIEPSHLSDYKTDLNLLQISSFRKKTLQLLPLSISLKCRLIKNVISDSNIFKLNQLDSKSCLFDGYFQDLKIYEKKPKAEILEKINKTLEKSKILKSAEEPMRSSTLVIHVRRGDFTKLKSFKVLDKDYYYNGIDKILAKKEITQIIFVTDDYKWVSANFISPYRRIPIIVHSNSFTEDFNTLYHSENVIISNSTFSYWTAILKEKENVVYPINWYRDKKTKMYFPSKWVGI